MSGRCTRQNTEQHRALGRQAIGSVSLLLLVALALSATVRVSRPLLSDAGRGGVPERALAVAPEVVTRAARRATCEKPPAAERSAGERVRIVRPEGTPVCAAPGVGPSRLREALLALPPPRC